MYFDLKGNGNITWDTTDSWELNNISRLPTSEKFMQFTQVNLQSILQIFAMAEQGSSELNSGNYLANIPKKRVLGLLTE